MGYGVGIVMDKIKKDGMQLADSSPWSDQKGIALVLALVMLMLLGFLGAFALSTSDTELRITGNYRARQASFFAADGGLEYAAKDGMIRSQLVANNVASYPTTSDPATVPGTGAGTTAKVRVDYMRFGDPPPGSGFDAVILKLTGKNLPATAFKMHYVTITSVGTGPIDSETATESMVGWVQPM